MTSRRVLIAIEERFMIPAGYAQFAPGIALARNICKRHGYEPVIRPLRKATSAYDNLTTDDYAFCIVPRLRAGNNWHVGGTKLTDMFDGSLGIATFVLSVFPNLSQISDNLGIDIGAGGYVLGNYKCSWKSGTVYARGMPCVADGVADVTPIVTTDANPDEFIVWRLNGENSNVYGDASDSQGTELLSLFPIMLQEAIDNGDVVALPKPAGCDFDLDDWPDNLHTLSDAETLYALMEQYGIPLTIGINPAIHNNFADPAERDAIFAHIAARTWVNGGLYYPIIHNTVQEYDQDYDTIKGVIESDAGVHYLRNYGMDIPYHQGRYNYFPNNRVGEDYLRLAAEYGVKCIRLGGPASADEGFNEPVRYNAITQQTRRGIRIVGSNSVFNASDKDHAADSADEIQSFAIAYGDMIGKGVYGNEVTYAHGTEFYIGHIGTTAPGYRFLQSFGYMVANCPNVLRWQYPVERAYN